MIAACIASLFVRPDVVIATSPQFFCGLAGSVVSWLKRLPFILEVRDIWPESITAVGAMKISFLVRQLQLLERLMYATATHIVTVGDGYKDRLLERGVPGAKVTVVTNGVDRHVFFRRDPDPSIRSRHGIDGQFLCAYVGTIGMACGLDVVLRAARILKQTGRSHIRFLLVGDGAVREVLERKARAEGLENVVFAGLRQKHEIPLYLAAADACLIHLRKMELFRSVLPSKMFEAAAMAKPIILGVEGSAASLLHRCGGGICVEPENESELVEAVAQLAERPGHAKVLGESAREFVLKHFDRDPLSRRYLNLVTGIVAAGRTPSPHRVPMSDGRGALDDTDDEQGLVDTL
jgi:glycosyltransferase involved in cell wall biosynthesis